MYMYIGYCDNLIEKRKYNNSPEFMVTRTNSFSSSLYLWIKYYKTQVNSYIIFLSSLDIIRKISFFLHKSTKQYNVK